MVINTNLAAQSSARLLTQSSANLSQSLARLSSGSKIISPADDAAGLAVATRMDVRIHRLNAANTCVGNAISFSQTQEGYLEQVTNALDRMSELAVLAQDVTKTDSDRALYQTEFNTLGYHIEAALGKAFNGVQLFDCNYVLGPLSVPVDGDGGIFSMDHIGYDTGLITWLVSDYGGASVSSAAGASAALVTVKSTISEIAQDRAKVGANLARLSYTSEQLTVLRDNLTAASSRIQDVDVADESTRYARASILVQAGTAMLAQANLTPQSALRLLSPV